MNLKKCISISCSLLAIILAPTADANRLTPAEKKINDAVIQQQDQQLPLLEKLVNINSGTSNVEGVQQVGALLQTEFQQLGFKTYWVDTPTPQQHAGTLIAEHQGTTGKKLLLIGHLDTVFPPTSTFKKFSQHDDIATGPGVVDIKGGDVVMLSALKALQAVHALDDATIFVVLTGDEEMAGKPSAITRKPLRTMASKSDIALDFESAKSLDTASINRRGISSWIVEATGNEGHSSLIFTPSAGDGAIFEMARIINTMRTQLAGKKNLTFNPGIITGGTKATFDEATSQATAFGKKNVIAEIAIAQGDIRFSSSQQKAATEKHFQAIVQQHLPGTSAAIHFEDAIPAMPSTSNNFMLLKKYSQASEDLGYGAIKPLDESVRGAGDISFIADKVSANLVGLGAEGEGEHSVNETLKIKSLAIQTQRAALLIYRLTR